jgi:hypothetical protein
MRGQKTLIHPPLRGGPSFSRKREKGHRSAAVDAVERLGHLDQPLRGGIEALTRREAVGG